MRKGDKIDFGKLLGFEILGDTTDAGLDLQDETLAARFGAKVGTELLVALDIADQAKLAG